MSSAFGWGVLAGSSLLIGGLIALTRPLQSRTLGLIMAFGAGVLVSAVAYELVLDAQVASHGSRWAAAGLFAGALAFYGGDLWVDRLGGEGRKHVEGSDSGSGPALVVGIVLDGVPESIVIGVSLISGAGVSLAMIVAVFLSNLPEGIAATTALRRTGISARNLYVLWIGLALVSGVAAAIGYRAFGDASPATIAFVQSFAAGAILTMLADTLLAQLNERLPPERQVRSLKFTAAPSRRRPGERST